MNSKGTRLVRIDSFDQEKKREFSLIKYKKLIPIVLGVFTHTGIDLDPCFLFLNLVFKTI